VPCSTLGAAAAHGVLASSETRTRPVPLAGKDQTNGWRETPPVFPEDVKARRDKMVGLGETRLKLHEDLPKAKTPHEQESLRCFTATISVR